MQEAAKYALTHWFYTGLVAATATPLMLLSFSQVSRLPTDQDIAAFGHCLPEASHALSQTSTPMLVFQPGDQNLLGGISRQPPNIVPALPLFPLLQWEEPILDSAWLHPLAARAPCTAGCAIPLACLTLRARGGGRS